jgi:AraC-like DNA-binding protein
MEWTERLNLQSGQIDWGEGNRAQVLQWNYRAHLLDNQPHRHTYFEICLVGDYGSGIFHIFGDDFQLSPGVTFFAQPGEVHQIVNQTEPGMELYWLSFSLEIGRGETGELLRAFCESRVAATYDSRISSIWRALREVAGGEWCASTPTQLSALSETLLLAIVQGGAGSNAPTPAAVPPKPPNRRAIEARVAVQYVHDNLGKKLLLAEIANYLHVSPRHLARLFNEFTGTSIAAYIERARLDRARMLLLSTDKTLKEVAGGVGYEDVSYFNRVFARGVGSPPGEFRRRGQPHVEDASGKVRRNPGDFV